MSLPQVMNNPLLMMQMQMMVPHLWADVNLIVNLSRYPLIRVVEFIFPVDIENILRSSKTSIS
jgi:hypothetical protein